MSTIRGQAPFADRIRRIRPRLLEGYVGALLEFADFVERRGLQLDSLAAVATTAAPLTPSVRHRLQSVLGVPVYDEYRSTEVQWMAGECRAQRGLHVFADMRRIEILGPDGRPVPPGEVGDIVVTDLANRVFPVIRYRLGDRGTLLPAPCACGVTLPLIDSPDGRVTDMIRFADGSIMAHRLMAMFSERPDAVRQFQIHQTADHVVHLRVVLNPDSAGAESAVDHAADTLRARVAGRAPVLVEHVDELPRRAGKLQYVISDVVPGVASTAPPAG